MKTNAVTLATAVMFLTRLPVGRFASGESRVLAQSVCYFPFVGLIVAVIMSAMLMSASTVLPLSVAVALSIVTGILATGAFHEDGMADTADSAGAFDVERKLAIMRDSRVGTYGSLGLIMTILLRFTLISELVMINMSTAVATLIAAHASSRWSSAFLMSRFQYVRAEAANKVVAQHVDSGVFYKSTAMLLVVMLLPAMIVSAWMLALLPVALLLALMCGVYFNRSYGGITGDCLGAANIIVEIVCMISIVASFHLLMQSVGG